MTLKRHPSPAFQFYPDDFISGTFSFSDKEVGQYIRLLSKQWNCGGLKEDEMAGATRSKTISDVVMAKFVKGSDGLLRNQRLERERRKQAEYRRKQAENGAKGGRPPTPKNANPSLSGGLANAKPNETQTEPKKSSPSPSPASVSISYSGTDLQEREQTAQTPSNASRNASSIAHRPSLEEVIAYGSMIGLAAWKAEDFFNEMEGCGWRDFRDRDVVSWQSILNRVRTKWEADGRPKAPPSRNSGHNSYFPPPRDPNRPMSMADVYPETAQ